MHISHWKPKWRQNKNYCKCNLILLYLSSSCLIIFWLLCMMRLTTIAFVHWPWYQIVWRCINDQMVSLKWLAGLFFVSVAISLWKSVLNLQDMGQSSRFINWCLQFIISIVPVEMYFKDCFASVVESAFLFLYFGKVSCLSFLRAVPKKA